MVVRPDASNQIGYLNGAQAATAAVASTGTPAGGGGFLRFGSSTYGRDQIAAMMLGGARTLAPQAGCTRGYIPSRPR